MAGDYTAVLTALIGAGAALIPSVLHTFLQWGQKKQELQKQYITQNRMDWIREMRALLGDFTEAYIRGKSGEELMLLKARIDLYIRFHDSSYDGLTERLKECVSTPYTPENYEKLMEACQKVLGDPWKRMKEEAGLSLKKDVELREKYTKE